MATRLKDATSTSTNKKAATTKAAPTTASSSQAKSRPSSSGEKQVPNYLKPTISSRHDAPANAKPVLNRRKSFDGKPATTASRAAVKPASPDRGAALAKSASAKSRTTSSKSKPLYAKSARKGNGESFVKKEGSSALAQQPLQGSDVDHDEHEDRVVEVAPEQDHGDNDDHGEAKTEVSDISIVSEELVAKPEEDDREVEEEKPEDHPSESQETTDKDEVIAIAKEEEAEEVAEKVEDKVEIEEVDNGETAVAAKELEDDNGDKAELKAEKSDSKEAKEEAKKGEGPSGKKEAQMAYNDVIEETASKLLEKRKNKVKALVGAFETVIDYESAAKQRESD